jgi:type I restriction enzyme, S subunit
VPSHWNVVPLSRVARQKTELGGTQRQLLSVYLNRGVVRFEDVDEKRTNATSDDLSLYQSVSPGDLVLNNQQAWRGSVGVSRHSGIVSPAYYVLRVSPALLPEYANLLFRDRCMVSQYVVCSKGIGTIQRNLYWPHLKQIGVLVPPLDEQAAIERFLNWANGRLERAIRAKRKVIALLNEQKKTIIRRAVTRGLSGSAPLVDSGVSWLGSIPRHWAVTRIKSEFKCLNTRRVPLNSTERGAMTSRLYDYYGASGVIDKVDDYLFDDELLLLAEDGANLVLPNLPLANVARGKFWVNNHAHILKPTRSSLVYLAHVLECLDYTPWITGAAQPKLTQDRLLAIAIAVAPLDEQEAIVRHIDMETQPIVAAIDRLQAELDRVPGRGVSP